MVGEEKPLLQRLAYHRPLAYSTCRSG